ncbi:hypothetical protein DPV78_008000 [Talaromyces pinophilus]|nr:hypothetical protein DPV78_008000 [Talaromyces pinophilus]
MPTTRNRVEPPQQAILKTPEQGQLTTKALNKEYSGPALILALPHELLAEILELAVIPNNIHELSWRHQESTYDPAVTLPVAYTCRRFSQVVVPFNYRSINFGYPQGIVPTNLRLRLLARTFQSNPSLGLHCREFKMHIPDITGNRVSSQEDFEFVEQILPFLPNVKSLYVHGGFGTEKNQQTWKLLRACVQHMRRLEMMELHREGEGLKVADVIREVQTPSLKGLCVGGFARSNSVSCLVDLNFKAASLTSLELSDYSDSPEALEKLLSWPVRLSKFTLAPFYHNVHYIDLPMIKQMLLQHRESLTDLDIGYLSPDGTGKFSHWSEFPNLENLTLSRWLFEASRENPNLREFQDELADYILAPGLKRFTLAFAIWDQHSEQWNDFGQEDEAWVRRLAQVALERKAALQEIRIQFDPEWWGPDACQTEYPWDRMDALNKEFQTRGIIITYTKPPVTREEWSTGIVNGEP